MKIPTDIYVKSNCSRKEIAPSCFSKAENAQDEILAQALLVHLACEKVLLSLTVLEYGAK
jgi:hypothetical protein